MFRYIALATAVALTIATTANAQSRGGGGGGGGRGGGGPPAGGGGRGGGGPPMGGGGGRVGGPPPGGGVRVGGPPQGGHPGGYPGGGHPGGGGAYVHPGYGYGYPRIGIGYYGSGFALGIGIGGLGYYGDYGYRPSVAVPYYVPYYAGNAADYGSGYYMPPATYPPADNTLPPPNQGAGLVSARITVQVPANAVVWVDEAQTRQSGAIREFVTPASLEAGKVYKYTLRAQWQENGQTVTREKVVEFQAGTAVIVNFSGNSGSSG